MKVLVTGASGRFAEYVVKALRDEHEIVLFSRKKPPADRADLPWIQGDLRDYDACVEAVKGVDAIQALGAVPGPSDHPGIAAARAERGMPPQDFGATMSTNIMGVYYLLMAAVKEGIKTFVMTGSNCAYGHGFRLSDNPFPIKYLPLDEEHPSDVEDSYSYTKLVGEELLAQFTRAYGIRTYVTRPSGITPPERLKAIAENIKPVESWTDWMYAYVPSEDLAELQKMIMEKADSLPKHSVYVANGLDSTCLEPTMDIVRKFRPDLVDVCKMEGHDAFFSIAKAQREVGWTPKTGWRDYLK